MVAGVTFPVAGGMPVFVISLRESRQLTTDRDFGTGPDVKVPCKCRVVGIVGGADAAAGDVVATDLDLTVRKYDGSTGTNLCSAIPVVDGSTKVGGGVVATLVTTEASLTLNAGDRLQLKQDVTAGTNPTFDGVWADVYCVPVN